MFTLLTPLTQDAPQGGKGSEFHAMPISMIERNKQVNLELVDRKANRRPNSLESMAVDTGLSGGGRIVGWLARGWGRGCF
jgi:hypothetical protein